MGDLSTLKAAVAAAIRTNGNQEITGQVLQNTLTSIINTLGTGAQYMGVATPSTNPGTPDAKVFYIASANGTYSNFGGITVNNEVVILVNSSGSWVKQSTGFATTDGLNNVINQIGTLSNLQTSTKTNLVAAINEVLTTFNTKIGDLASLTTEEKNNLVAAINEVIEDIDTLGANMSVFTPETNISGGIVNKTTLVKYGESATGYENISVRVSKGDKVKIGNCVRFNNTFTAAFYHLNGAYVKDAIENTIDNTPYHDIVITVPEGVDTLYVNNVATISGGYLNVAKSKPISATEIMEDIEEVRSMSNKISETKVTKAPNDNLLNKNDEDYQVGYFLLRNGIPKEIAWTGIAVSQFIPIKEGEIIKSNSNTNSALYMCLYDANKNCIEASSVGGQSYIVGTALAKYARFTLWDNESMEYAIKKVSSAADEVVYTGEYNEIDGYLVDVKKDIESLKVPKHTIICDGDSLTFGQTAESTKGDGTWDYHQAEHNYPSVLKNLLGSSYEVINFGVPGSQSATLVANATGYVVDESFVIPATKTQVAVKCSMIAGRRDVNAVFGPVTSFNTMGGCNPVVINGIEGTFVPKPVDTPSGRQYEAWFTRSVAGSAVSCNVGTLIMTNESRYADKASHMIFIGQNRGWLKNGSNDINNVENINELVKQIKCIANSSDELYVVVSSHLFYGTGSGSVWVGEAIFEQEFGSRYINLREYMSQNGIQQAIGKGYLPNDGTYPTSADTTAKQQGKCPPSLLLQNNDGIHFTDVGYHLLGDLVFNKYIELYKRKILGEL